LFVVVLVFKKELKCKHIWCCRVVITPKVNRFEMHRNAHTKFNKISMYIWALGSRK